MDEIVKNLIDQRWKIIHDMIEVWFNCEAYENMNTQLEKIDVLVASYFRNEILSVWIPDLTR